MTLTAKPLSIGALVFHSVLLIVAIPNLTKPVQLLQLIKHLN